MKVTMKATLFVLPLVMLAGRSSGALAQDMESASVQAGAAAAAIRG